MLLLLVWCIWSKNEYTAESSTPCIHVYSFWIFCYLSEHRHPVHMGSTCTLLLIFDRCVYVVALGRFWVHFIMRGFIQIIKSYIVLVNKTKSACTVLNLFCDSDNFTFPQLVESLSRLLFNTKFILDSLDCRHYKLDMGYRWYIPVEYFILKVMSKCCISRMQVKLLHN